jgi:hypothetical protein
MVQTDLKTNTQDLCSLEKKKRIFSPTPSLTSPEKLLTWIFFITSQGKFSIGGKRRHLNGCLNL